MIGLFDDNTMREVAMVRTKQVSLHGLSLSRFVPDDSFYGLHPEYDGCVHVMAILHVEHAYTCMVADWPFLGVFQSTLSMLHTATSMTNLERNFCEGNAPLLHRYPVLYRLVDRAVLSRRTEPPRPGPRSVVWPT
jgi:hypothetical protein